VQVEQSDIKAYVSAFFKVYSRVQYGSHGLGQCAKKIGVYTDGTIDFLSKLGMVVPGFGVRLYRNLPRIAILQSHSDSRLKDESVLR